MKKYISQYAAVLGITLLAVAAGLLTQGCGQTADSRGSITGPTDVAIQNPAAEATSVPVQPAEID